MGIIRLDLVLCESACFNHLAGGHWSSCPRGGGVGLDPRRQLPLSDLAIVLTIPSHKKILIPGVWNHCSGLCDHPPL